MSLAEIIRGCSRLEIATYSLDLGAAYWLASLRAKGAPTARFVCDPSAFRPWFPRASGKGALRVRPAGSRKLFHPKMWRVRKRTDTVWCIGSGNISIPECRTARNFFAIARNSKELGRRLDSSWQALIGGRSSFVVIDAMRRKLISRDEPLSSILWPLVRDFGPRAGRCAIASSAGISKSLLLELIETGKVGVVQAFVGGDAVRAVPKIDRKVAAKVQFFAPKSRSGWDLHGKLFYCEGAEWAVLYLGSANFTRAAYDGNNVESGLIVRDRKEQLCRVVQTLLAGRWKIVRPSAASQEPSDEADEYGDSQLQRDLAQCVEVDRGKGARRVVIRPERLKKPRYRISRVELRRSGGECLGQADSLTGWALDLHSGSIDQELVFHFTRRPPASIWLAAIMFDDSAAEVGQEPLSLEDIFLSKPPTRRRRSRRYGRAGTRAEQGNGQPADVRFPWHLLPKLRKWRGDRQRAADAYARKLLRDANGDKAGRVQAAIVREVVLASRGR